MLTQKQFDDALERLNKMQELARDLGCSCKHDCLHCKEWADKSCGYISQARVLLDRGYAKLPKLADELTYEEFVEAMNHELLYRNKPEELAKSVYSYALRSPAAAYAYFVEGAKPPLMYEQFVDKMQDIVNALLKEKPGQIRALYELWTEYAAYAERYFVKEAF